MKQLIKENLKSLGLFVVAIFLFILIIPTFFVGQIVVRLLTALSLKKYIYNMALAVDKLGGSFIYNTKNHTISAMNGYYANRGSGFLYLSHAYITAPIIDLFFGKRHCYNTALKEGLLNG